MTKAGKYIILVPFVRDYEEGPMDISGLIERYKTDVISLLIRFFR